MWKMCPTEIWMCIKLLVDLDVYLKIIDEITPKKFYLKILPAPVHKPLLGFKIGPCELWLGVCDGECSRATNDPRIWMKRKLMFC